MDFFIRKDIDQLSLSFDRLLLPVKQWVLDELIDDLKTEFQKENTAEDFMRFRDIVQKYLKTVKINSEYDLTWKRCVIFLCLQLLSRSIDRPVIWTGFFTDQKAVDSDEVVIDEFVKLYALWESYAGKEGEFAQPYAYYLLFMVAIADGDLKDKIRRRKDNDKLRGYLHCTETGRSHISDRLTEFVKDYYVNGNKLIAVVDPSLKLKTSEHFEKLDLRNVHIDRILDPLPRINVLAVGIPGSGKSTIINIIRHVLMAPEDSKIQMPVIPIPISQLEVVTDKSGGIGEGRNFFGSLSERTKPTLTPLTEATGAIKINSTEYAMSFFDTQGDVLMKPPPKYVPGKDIDDSGVLESVLVTTDLLLIILDPETIFYKAEGGFSFEAVLGFITSRLDYLFHHSKHAMIALIFAKFDEYGSIIRGPRNLIHNDTQIQCLLKFMETGSDQAWAELVDEISESYLNNGAETGLQRSVVLLLGRLKYLIRVILYGKKHPVLNFYISSSAVTKVIKNSLLTGYPEVFNDFADYMGRLIKKLKIAAPVKFKYVVAKNTISIEWFNPSDRELYSIIERKTGDGEFKVINQATLILKEETGKYNDDAEYDQTYIYRVKFIDSLTDQNPSPYSDELTVNVPSAPLKDIFPPVDLGALISEEDESIRLEWNNINSIAVFNELEKKGKIGDYTTVFNQQPAENSKLYLDKNIERGKIYYYRMRATESDNLKNVSSFGEEVQVKTTPNKIKQVKCDLTPNKDSPKCVELKWEESQNEYPVSYSISKITTNKKGVSLQADNNFETDNNAWTDNDIKRGNSYKYVVTVVEKTQQRTSPPTESEIIIINNTNRLTWIILTILVVIVIVLLFVLFNPA